MTAQPLGNDRPAEQSTADLHGMVLLALILAVLAVITLLAL